MSLKIVIVNALKVIFIVILHYSIFPSLLFSQTGVWTKEDYLNLQHENTAINKEIKVVMDTLEQQAINYSKNLSQEKELIAVKGSYNTKAKELLIPTENAINSIDKLIKEQKNQIEKLEKFIPVDLKRELDVLEVEAKTLLGEKQALESKVHELDSIRAKQKHEIMDFNGKTIECLIEAWNKEVESLNNRADIDEGKIGELHTKKSRLTLLGVDTSLLKNPDRYISYCKSINNAKRRLEEQCNISAIGAAVLSLNNLLADKNLDVEQEKNISIFINLLRNYSITVDLLSKEIYSISGLWGTDPLLSKDAKEGVEKLEQGLDKEYKYLMRELSRLKSLVEIEGGAKNHNIKCIN